MIDYFAHSAENADKNKWQSLRAHLVACSEKAAAFSKGFDDGEIAYIAALFHDVGKYSDAFQHKLEGESVFVEHSLAGALELTKRYTEDTLTKIASQIAAYCIMGHHAGLPNGGTNVDTNDEATYKGRLKRSAEDYSAFFQELKDELGTLEQLNLPPCYIDGNLEQTAFKLALLTRFIYSCVTDADFLDTEEFYLRVQGISSSRREIIGDFQVFGDKVKLLQQKLSLNQTEINNQRQYILNCCLSKAGSPTSLFSLTVPTGGGKTLASLRFALLHLLENNKKRIIYAIPYTSIIDQTAKTFKDLLGKEYVLEHHSNLSISQDKNDDSNKLLLATENWDAPIVVTTNVQFFESFFSNKSSKARKLHNIANSVIILDEAQMIPVEYFKPCIWLLEELSKNYNCSVVFCTATQPNIKPYLRDAKSKIIEIVENYHTLFNEMKRVSLVNIGRKSDEDLCSLLAEYPEFLVIVNTRRHANELCKLLGDNCFVLSTLLTPKDRKEEIDFIKDRLKQKLPCKVVSTSLIEAGVDIDFPVVYRSLCGLDSIVQAAGRCNREGSKSEAKVYIFEPDSLFDTKNNTIKAYAAITKAIFEKYEDAMCADAMNEYFTSLHKYIGDKNLDSLDLSDKYKIQQRCGLFANFAFADVANEFEMIKSNTVAIYISKDEEAQKMLTEFKVNKSRALFRKMQTYCVNIYQYELEKLCSDRKIELIDNSLWVLKDLKLYNKNSGLNLYESIDNNFLLY